MIHPMSAVERKTLAPVGRNHQVEIPPRYTSGMVLADSERAGECLYSPEAPVAGFSRREHDRIFTKEQYAEWTSSEVALFENSMNFFYKDFNVISKIMSREGFNRSVSELVQFYYQWKKSCSRWDVTEESEESGDFDEVEACCDTSEESEDLSQMLSGKKRKMNEYPEFLALQSEKKVMKTEKTPMLDWSFVYQDPSDSVIMAPFVMKLTEDSERHRGEEAKFGHFEIPEIPSDPYFDDYSSSLEAWNLW